MTKLIHSLRHAPLSSISIATSIALLLGASNALAYYVSPAQVDVTKVIAPAPTADSEEQKLDMQAVLDAQSGRTAEEIQRANETEQLSVFGFSDVLGSSFNEKDLPRTAALFQHVFDDTLDLLKGGKEKWNRPRPFLVSDEVQPSGEMPKSASYPSGNSWVGHLYAIIMADLIPSKATQIFARGKETGDNRIIAGVHFPSDVVAGRQAAAAMAAALWEAPGFRDDLEAARAKLVDAGLTKPVDYSK